MVELELSADVEGKRVVALRELRGADELALPAAEGRTLERALFELVRGLVVAGPGMVEPASLGQITLADRDRLYAALQRTLFGDAIEAVARCGACGTDYELRFALQALEAARPPRLDAEGCLERAVLDEAVRDAASLDAALLDEAALAEAAGDEAELAEVARGEGRAEGGEAARDERDVPTRSRRAPAPSAEWSEPTAMGAPAALRVRAPRVDEAAGWVGEGAGAAFRAACVSPSHEAVISDAALDAALERGAPRLDVALDAPCPSCGAAREERFEIGAWLARSLLRERDVLLREVHTLARAYGWSLESILSLSRAQRHALVRLVVGGEARA